MNETLISKLEEFVKLVDSLYDDILLDQNEKVEHKLLQSRLENFALSIKGETTLEESPVNQARALFVQIYRMSLSRGRRAVFFEKTDAIEREASKIPHDPPIYFDKDELSVVAKAAAYYEYALTVGDDLDEPVNRACQKLKSALVKKQTTVEKK